MPGPDEIPSGDNFADWVRSRRIAVMLTQEELAQRAGLSVRTVRNLEAGRKGTPRLPTRRLIIAALTGADPAPSGPGPRETGVASADPG